MPPVKTWVSYSAQRAVAHSSCRDRSFKLLDSAQENVCAKGLQWEVQPKCCDNHSPLEMC